MVIKTNNQQLINDLTENSRFTWRFHAWMGFLTLCLVACLSAYYGQLKTGLGVTGMRDYISWGLYVSNFIFFVATSLIGMLICSVLGLLKQDWISPFTRIAEIIAFAFALVAGLVIITDMGRPERLLNVFIYGRFTSPLIWDLALLILYVLIIFLLFFVQIIPDMAVLKGEGKQLPHWPKTIYRTFSFNWKGTPGQQNLRERAVRILLIMSVPVAVALHTVTSWLFALTPRIGWNSTTFGPYFVTGAFVSGVSCLIIVTFILRKIFGLGQYLTEFHFDKLARLLVIVSLVYLYFNINEYFVPAYKASKEEALLLKTLFTGDYAPLFWMVQFASVLLPSFLPVLKFFRKIIPLFILSIFAFAGSWLKRYLIVVPVLENPFLPVQNVPDNFMYYRPTIQEIAVTLGPVLLVIMIISLLVKLFPVIPVSKTEGEVQERIPD